MPEQPTMVAKQDEGDTVTIAEKQRKAPDLAILFQWIQDGCPPKEEVSLESRALRSYWLTWSQITQCGQLLYYKWNEPNGQGQLLLLVPCSMQADLIRDHHDPPVTAHPGVEKTLGLLRQCYHWHGMRRAVEAYVQQCKGCAVDKQEVRKWRAPLQSYQAGMPMERLHVDVLGPFP